MKAASEGRFGNTRGVKAGAVRHRHAAAVRSCETEIHLEKD